MDEVEILAEFYPGLKNVRIVLLSEALDYMRNTTTDVGYRWTMINADNYDNFFLHPGQGILCFISLSTWELWGPGMPLPNNLAAHAFCIWRGIDGDFCVYDPSGYLRYPGVEEIIYQMGGHHIFTKERRTQGYAVGSCLMYSLVFMDYACQHINLPTGDLLDIFFVYLGTQSDERVVQMICDLFQQAGIELNLKDDDWPSYARLQRPSEEDKQEEQVSAHLSGLTEKQIAILMKSNTVKVKKEVVIRKKEKAPHSKTE